MKRGAMPVCNQKLPCVGCVMRFRLTLRASVSSSGNKDRSFVCMFFGIRGTRPSDYVSLKQNRRHCLTVAVDLAAGNNYFRRRNFSSKPSPPSADRASVDGSGAAVMETLSNIGEGVTPASGETKGSP